jgi:hypothetical protein
VIDFNFGGMGVEMRERREELTLEAKGESNADAL